MTTEKTDAEAVDMQAMMTAAAAGEDLKEEQTTEQDQDALEKQDKEVVEEEEQKPEQKNKPPEDNRDRSNLGRKVEALWSRMDEQKQTYEKLTNVLDAMLEKEKKLAAAKEAEDDEEIVLTKAQAKKLAEEQAKKVLEERAQGRNAYERGYHDQLLTLSLEYEPDEFDAIKDIMMKDFNVKHSDNPSFDAVRNFQDAHIKFLKEGKPKLPKGNLPTGAKIATTGSEKIKKKTNPLPKLDAAAQKYLDFVRRTRGEDAAKKIREST